MQKRVFDLAFVLLFSPFIVLAVVGVAIGVRLALGSPIFFRQQRPGRDEVPFELVKFRTMREALDSQGEPLPDAQRLTRFGAFLRSTSLDELPEFWNVLKGEMSLVGPRPLLCEYLKLYSPRQALRHKVRPGLTGWAQVNGRNNLSWEDKLEMDSWYVENRNLILDMKILLMTVVKVLSRSDINRQGEATVEKFRGGGL